MCFPGQYIDGGKCKPCPGGQYAPTGKKTKCLKCPVGTTSEKSIGSIRCVKCKPGYYNSVIGSRKCHACPDGTYSNVTGAISRTTCKKCPKGTTSEERSASTKCLQCKAGYYADKEGLTSCLPCPAGTYGTVNGAWTKDLCYRCPSDSVSSRGSSECTKCESGTHPNEEQSSCVSD